MGLEGVLLTSSGFRGVWLWWRNELAEPLSLGTAYSAHTFGGFVDGIVWVKILMEISLEAN
jgi:hypothetical protein